MKLLFIDQKTLCFKGIGDRQSQARGWTEKRWDGETGRASGGGQTQARSWEAANLKTCKTAPLRTLRSQQVEAHLWNHKEVPAA